MGSMLVGIERSEGLAILVQNDGDDMVAVGRSGDDDLRVMFGTTTGRRVRHVCLPVVVVP